MGETNNQPREIPDGHVWYICIRDWGVHEGEYKYRRGQRYLLPDGQPGNLFRKADA